VTDDCTKANIPLLRVADDRESRCIRFESVGNESAKTRQRTEPDTISIEHPIAEPNCRG